MLSLTHIIRFLVDPTRPWYWDVIVNAERSSDRSYWWSDCEYLRMSSEGRGCFLCSVADLDKQRMLTQPKYFLPVSVEHYTMTIRWEILLRAPK